MNRHYGFHLELMELLGSLAIWNELVRILWVLISQIAELKRRSGRTALPISIIRLFAVVWMSCYHPLNPKYLDFIVLFYVLYQVLFLSESFGSNWTLPFQNPKNKFYPESQSPISRLNRLHDFGRRTFSSETIISFMELPLLTHAFPSAEFRLSDIRLYMYTRWKRRFYQIPIEQIIRNIVLVGKNASYLTSFFLL